MANLYVLNGPAKGRIVALGEGASFLVHSTRGIFLSPAWKAGSKKVLLLPWA